MKKAVLFTFVFFICVFISRAQPFRADINAFRHKDSVQMPAAHSILFVGSSSFTKWTDVQDYFPGYPVINRGFGGSSLPDVIGYANEVIFPYRPRQIVVYCGENDIAASDTVTAELVLSRVKQLYAVIRAKLPSVEVDFISIKPSISRWKFEPTIVRANRLIKQFIATQKHAAFINVHDAMLKRDGSVMTDIFVADNLHMNAKGYHIWQPIIQKYLNRN